MISSVSFGYYDYHNQCELATIFEALVTRNPNNIRMLNGMNLQDIYRYISSSYRKYMIIIYRIFKEV